MKQLSKHNALQHAFIDGAEIQFFSYRKRWEDTKEPTWSDDTDFRIKPAEPEKAVREYPVTKMTPRECYEAYSKFGGFITESYVGIANAAIRRAIDDGQVVLPEAVSELLVMTCDKAQMNREMRDMAIAKATRLAYFYAGSLTDKELEKIIVGVK